MGQRHQIYIRIHNPLMNPSVVKDLSSFSNKEPLEHAYAVFGKKKYAILAFHHQWLYGLTAAATCFNIMQEVLKADHECHILNKDIKQLPYPVYYCDDKDKVDGFKEIIRAIFFNQLNLDFAAQGARYELAKVSDLVEELYDRKTKKFDKRWDYRKDFRLGDNNDGITIIDAVERKYCFMSIGGIGFNKYKVPDYVPLTADRYVRAYYSTAKSYLTPYDIENTCHNNESEVKELLIENQERIKFVKESFSKFQLLTTEDLKKMFPAVYRDFAKKAQEKAQAELQKK